MGSGVLIDSHREGGSMCGKRGSKENSGCWGMPNDSKGKK